MRAVSIAAVVVCAVLALRRIVLMDRFFEARAVLITALLYCLFFAFLIFCATAGAPPCYEPPPDPADKGEPRFFMCTEY